MQVVCILLHLLISRFYFVLFKKLIAFQTSPLAVLWRDHWKLYHHKHSIYFQAFAVENAKIKLKNFHVHRSHKKLNGWFRWSQQPMMEWKETLFAASDNFTISIFLSAEKLFGKCLGKSYKNIRNRPTFINKLELTVWRSEFYFENLS